VLMSESPLDLRCAGVLDGYMYVGGMLRIHQSQGGVAVLLTLTILNLGCHRR